MVRAVRADKNKKAAAHRFKKWYKVEEANMNRGCIHCKFEDSQLYKDMNRTPHMLLYFLVNVLQRLVDEFLAKQCIKRTLCHDVRGYHEQVPAVHHRSARVPEVSILVSGDRQSFSAYKQRPDFLERAWPFRSPSSSIGIGISVNVRNSCKRRRRECSCLVAIG